MSSKIKLFDIVALTRDIPERGLRRGQVGTVVDRLIKGAFEVEFADQQGRAYAFAPINSEDMLVLSHEPSGAGSNH